MMEHAWCSDIARDKAIRRAEDDAANWRRLEVGEVVQDGDEYLDPYGVWKDVTGVTRGKTYDSRTFADHRRRRVPLPDHRDLPQAVKELRERVGRLEAVIPKSVSASNSEAHENKVGTMPADGLRTERVTLEITQRAESYAPCRDLDWQRMLRQTPGGLFPGESVRVVEEATIGSGDVFADVGCGSTGDEIARLTAERDAARERAMGHAKEADELRAERDAAKDECERLGHIVSKYQETRQWSIEKIEDCCVRICFGDHHRACDCEWEYFIPVSREADLQNQRSGAIRERDEARADLATMQGKCEGLKDRVAELEAAAKAAPAANAGGVSNPEPISGAGKTNCQGKLDSSQEPVAWGVNWGDHWGGEDSFSTAHVYRKREWAKTVASTEPEATLVPLYAAPQPPRGWLTEEMRDDLDEALEWLNCQTNVFAKRAAAAIATTLARSTPPRVKVPNLLQQNTWQSRDSQWIAAIREAGGEVE